MNILNFYKLNIFNIIYKKTHIIKKIFNKFITKNNDIYY